MTVFRRIGIQWYNFSRVGVKTPEWQSLTRGFDFEKIRGHRLDPLDKAGSRSPYIELSHPGALECRTGGIKMAEQQVQCVKLGREAPGLSEAPIPGELGQKVYENVSEEGWNMFLEYFKMVVNEYRLNLMDDSTDEIFTKSVEDFFFGDGATMPEGYVPPQTKG